MSKRHSLEHIIDVSARAGFSGIEPEVVMLGRLADPPALKQALSARGQALGALCLVETWAHAEETAAERSNADRFIDLVRRFPGTMLVLCQMPGRDRVDLRQRQIHALACVNKVAGRAREFGIPCTFHPNSPPGSIFRTAEDYQLMMDGLDPAVVGYAPDLGHIAAGGMDPFEVVAKYRSRVNHLHFKNILRDGTWADMRRGVIDFPAVVSFLKQTGFDGWIMIEDECARAETDPDAATMDNGDYVRQRLLPLVR